METWLRRLLVLCGFALMILGIVQFVVWILYAGTSLTPEVELNLQITLGLFLSGFLNTFQPIGIGALCLFAAHSMRPFEQSSGKN